MSEDRMIIDAMKEFGEGFREIDAELGLSGEYLEVQVFLQFAHRIPRQAFDPIEAMQCFEAGQPFTAEDAPRIFTHHLVTDKIDPRNITPFCIRMADDRGFRHAVSAG